MIMAMLLKPAPQPGMLFLHPPTIRACLGALAVTFGGGGGYDYDNIRSVQVVSSVISCHIHITILWPYNQQVCLFSGPFLKN